MEAYNVDTKRTEEINEILVFGIDIFIGQEQAVLDYCQELEDKYLRGNYPNLVAKILSMKWLDDGRVVVGFGFHMNS